MTDFRHRTDTVEGLHWHWVEMGEGEPVVLLHGIPESWECWKAQIPMLADQFRVIALDLKGYGQSDKADGDYSGLSLAREILALLDAIDVGSFRLAGHDWGTFVADNICHVAGERILQYVRSCLSLHVYDPRNSLHHQWISRNPGAAAELMSRPEAYVRVWFESACKPELCPSTDVLSGIAAEFSYEGVATAVPRYFRDLRNAVPIDYSRFSMPVLYIHGEHDPRQPIEYVRGMEQHVPGLEAVLVLDSGHFVTRERPLETAQAMTWFFNAMLAPGLPLFERSRAYGLPTRPVGEPESWGLNAFAGANAAVQSAEASDKRRSAPATP